MNGRTPAITGTEPLRTSYVLDNAWHAERERLGSITELYDAGTLELSKRLGLTTGWRCLDLGAGTGSIVELYADRVGPTGEVLAIDADTRFLDPLDGGNISVRRSDVTVDPLPADHFDLVHARLLLESVRTRDDVLRAMTTAVRPGGWVLVEDLDWSTASVIDPPAEVHQRVVRACETFFSNRSYDPYYGRKLPRAFQAAGLVDIGTQAVSIQVQSDPEHGLRTWELLVDQLGPGMLADGLVTQADIDAFHQLWHDGTTVCFGPLLVSTWGRRPVLDDVARPDRDPTG
ncbi:MULTISPECIES: methyltransferase domain-containing protein [unclassified Frankia]|uniref:methyltransferase domain-containing protein n=1 Tax=unclassified Frankia TaxID=2632575 RepID=UPI002AD30B7A|nr:MULTISPECIES: methyltransferase domain-containing protein [unclassified Frankia]